MIYLLIVVIVVLLLLVFKLYHEKKKIRYQLSYMTEKMNQIISNPSAERLLLMTEEKELRNLLNEINRLLDFHHQYIADNAKVRMSMNRMLSNVSHDLRTPLTVILGYLETMEYDKKLTDQKRGSLLTKVRRKALEVSDLINKFFDLAKLESGDWQLDIRKVHLNEVCAKAIVGYYDTLSSKGFAVETDIPQEPIFLYADPEAITRILDNLLTNAIRYGKDGKMVGIALEQDEDHVYLKVSDRGKGIKEQEKQRIFERLYTLNDSRSRQAEGSGIGLTIAKHLTEQMNGQITYASTPYTKTVFTVQFPKALNASFLT
ncbi:sensor histidine kinase [Gracilibacillus dipsosauri]|uniref:histidine kinase n=1 Tax=Gracilibacillus dipsosauri TaxID=178340 RepID=A0A317L1W6_9BACI|nr:HAMP domain-containing sensor histidine kinase [Gracilibacillus dipsosauri]PWU69802.1 sensor histidine kinase [Gracilibacillus dipsosauri]